MLSRPNPPARPGAEHRHKADAIVFDGEHDGIRLERQPEDDMARGRMFVDILESLLGHTKERAGHVWRQRPLLAVHVKPSGIGWQRRDW